MKYIIGIGIILVALVWGTTAFLGSTVQYVPIEQAAASNQTVQVMGKIDFEQVNYNEASSRLEFVIYDPESDTPHDCELLPVVYYGVVPGNFSQATSVVVKGKPDQEGKFIAEHMYVKCPSKYQGEQGKEYQDIKKHEEAVGTA
jgi:cytochrome c-type biogenesis protein CcmE